ncbi:hypothetical protein POM88_044036 [Heracleum sosnowskyi]|uniref:polynucleotide adenylyltransferase n=1 Tax=Heracleum sosnowskyi TaxID=360622 RepID=A0AAD8H4N0_9APIA|nr:hypothetical protein POM88_044036 [Heracleum sosnowskyi]
MGSLGSGNAASGSFGVITGPISTSGPTEYDVVKTAELEKLLADAGLHESREEAIKREEVLGRLDQIVKIWVKNVCRAKGFNEELVQEANAKIFTFGSYRLGVHGPGADIDTLCVGPRYVTRNDHFFGELHGMLAEMPEIQDLHPVSDAHVPVMKFKYNGISIDLLYANVAMWSIPEDLDVSRESILQNVDGQTVLSLNGCRVTDQILRLVPNIQNFRTTLRCVRFWAKCRGVYSNVMGFLEFKRGNKICKALEKGDGSWNILFERFSFFEAYRHYLQIDISAENDEDSSKWKGWVESRLRLLTLKIERDMAGVLQPPQPVKVSGRSQLPTKRRKNETSQVNVVAPKKMKLDVAGAGISIDESGSAATCGDNAEIERNSGTRRNHETGFAGGLDVKRYTHSQHEGEGSVKFCQPSLSECTGSSIFADQAGDHGQSNEPNSNHQGSSKVLDHLEDNLHLMDPVENDVATKGSLVQSSTKHEAEEATEETTVMGNTSCYKFSIDGGLDELEPVALANIPRVAAETKNQPQKPCIRLNFTSLTKETMKGS